MQQRPLGTQGLTTSAIGYGAMGTAYAYGPSDDTESIAAIRRAHDLGVTHFDTAELYGWGTGERLLGTALAPIRDEVTIATKFGFTPETYRPNSQLDHIREVVDTSLKNLNLDSIDLLYQHIDDPEVPIEDVIGVMKEYVDAGKVKYLGLSNTSPDRIRAAHAVHPISVLQTEYSVFARDSEAFFPVLEELGIGLVAYSPLGRGFLSGAVRPRAEYDADDMRHIHPWWAPENFDENKRTADELADFAAKKGVSLSQLSIAWLLAQRPYVVPIPGSKNPDRVAQNIGAADVVLTADELAEITRIAPTGAVGKQVWTRE